MKEIILNISGMHCEGCENRIKNSLNTIEGVEEVIASHKEGTVKIKISKDVNLDEIKELIDDLGFEVKEN